MEKNQIIVAELKKQNPEMYFQEVLALGEYEELKTLVDDSWGLIPWWRLAKTWVVKLEGNKIEWIYWEWNLDFKWTKIKSLWKLKEIWWDLDISFPKLKSLGNLKKVWWTLYWRNVETLESLWDLEEVWSNLWLDRTKLKSLGKLRKVWWKLSCISIETLEELWELEEVWWSLYMDLTKLKTLSNLKKVWWSLYCNHIKTLEDLWELEETWWDLNIMWTNIKELGKLKKVWWFLYLKWSKVKSLGKLKTIRRNLFCGNIVLLKKTLDFSEEEVLEDIWELHEIWWNLYLKGTKIEFQKKMFDIIKRKKLIVKKNIFFWWNMEMIEELLNIRNIRGTLDISGLDIRDKITVIKRITKEKLRVSIEWLDDMEEMILWLYKEWELDIVKYKKIFGEDVRKIEDEEIKEIVIVMIQEEYKHKKAEIKRKCKKIIEENKEKELTEEEKKKLRNEIKTLDQKLSETKSKLENLGLKL